MALRPDRYVRVEDISRTCSDVAGAGVILCISTSGSGVALGDSAGTAVLNAASSSGCIPHGLLMHDIVSLDETLYHRNWHKDLQLTGERCRVMREGEVTTDKVTGTPTDGATAYVVASGLVSPTKHAVGGVAMTPPVGVFLGIKDADGYVKLQIQLPSARA